MKAKPDPSPPMLPGLEPVEHRGVTELEKAVRRTIAALSKDEGLSERHAAYCAMALELCNVIAIKQSAGRLSTAAHDFRELRELLDALAPAEDGMDPELRRALEAWGAEQ